MSTWMVMGDLRFDAASSVKHSLRAYSRAHGLGWYVASMVPWPVARREAARVVAERAPREAAQQTDARARQEAEQAPREAEEARRDVEAENARLRQELDTLRNGGER